METIKHAAIKRSDKIISIGKCHADIIKESPYRTCKAGSIMGFLTSKHRFVSRKEAFKIAVDSNQIQPDIDTTRKNILISENIWADTGHEYDPKKGYYIP